MDYDRLNSILTYLNQSRGYRGWANYRDWYLRVNNYELDVGIHDGSYSVWGNILLNLGLVDYKFSMNDGHTYAITAKGIFLFINNRTVQDAHEDIKRKEQLEKQILLATLESHNTAERATNLNKIQLVVTVLLGFVTLASIFFQYKSNEIAERAVKVAEQANELVQENEKNKSVDTIFIRFNENVLVPKAK